MNERVARLRAESQAAEPSISGERAALVTAYYKAHLGTCSAPKLRAGALRHVLTHKAIYLGEGELILGERGPRPKAVPTYPEISCHSIEDLQVLHGRPKTFYRVDAATLEHYAREVIPFWTGRSLRDQMFRLLPEAWHQAYGAGWFTEFMEQRSPGHTVLDDKIYLRGLRDFQKDIAASLAALDFEKDPHALDRREQLEAMDMACDAVIAYAWRHAEAAERAAAATSDPRRAAELNHVAAICRRVPAEAPRTFHEAIQAYWFCHVAVITELNGWDAFCPGHLDQHLTPFFQREVAAGTLTREHATELLGCLFVKFNNHPAPPKVGVTAAESGTYTDFANINLGGLLQDGTDGSSEVTHLLLDVIDGLHLLQPSNNLQVSIHTPDAVLRHALQVIRKGYGFPSLFNADMAVKEQVRVGKSLEDARAGGCSGCVEVGAFGKEAYILTGYFNLVKTLELALNRGVDPRSGQRLGPDTGAPGGFGDMEALLLAFQRQLLHGLAIKIQGNAIIERLYATQMPVPFLSVLTDDCILRGMDYHAGGARYNNTYIQAVGIGTLTDALAAVNQEVFEGQRLSMEALLLALRQDYCGQELLRQRLLNRTPKYGNDDDRADDLMVKVFNLLFEAIDGRPTTKPGGAYRLEMLPTTCHVYFGEVCGASADGRHAGQPLSEGISPVQGMDRKGPTAVLRSAGKMDHERTGGTLLNLKFTPSLAAGEVGLDTLTALVRGYFALGGHHVQFNVVDAEQLREAQRDPEAHRNLIVRVAGYSDYFLDCSPALQEEIIARTAHACV